MDISKALIGFTLILIACNTFFLFQMNLPNTVSETSPTTYLDSNTYDTSNIPSLEDMESDMNGLQTNVTNVTANLDKASTPNPFVNIVYGAFAAGAAITAGLGFVGLILNYLFMLLFGFVIWIDFFIAPMGTMFTPVGIMIKAIMFFIQLAGLATLLLPFFGAWRGN